MTVHQFQAAPKRVKGSHRGVQFDIQYDPDATLEEARWKYALTITHTVHYEETASTQEQTQRLAIQRIDDMISKGLIKRG